MPPRTLKKPFPCQRSTTSFCLCDQRGMLGEADLSRSDDLSPRELLWLEALAPQLLLSGRDRPLPS